MKGSAKSASSPDLDEILHDDAKTRKQRLSKFNWYQENIKTRRAAETKLRQSTGMPCLQQLTTEVVVGKNVSITDQTRKWQVNNGLHFPNNFLPFPPTHHFPCLLSLPSPPIPLTLSSYTPICPFVYFPVSSPLSQFFCPGRGGVSVLQQLLMMFRCSNYVLNTSPAFICIHARRGK